MSYEQFIDRFMARRRNIPRQRRRLRLSLEPLEDRRLLSAVSFQAEDVRLPDVASDGVLQSTLAEGIFSTPKTGPMGKLSNMLASTFEHYGTYLSQAELPGFQPANSLVQVSDGLIQINAVASGDADALLGDLQSLGFQESSTWGSRISGRIALDAVDELAELDSLQLASAALRPWTNVGVTDSQGDAAMNADLARAQFGIDGSGVTVGVLSNSFNTSGVGSYAADIASGDLPAGINVMADYPGSTDEGRGMMQLIHDVAPGAEMAFHTAYSTEVDFANGILALAGAGADVIVDDIIYLEEPMFQDGVIAQAVDTVEAGGISYFSSAGNSDRNSYESAFVDSGISLQVDGQQRGMLHDFDPTPGVDPLQSIYVPFFSGFLMSFQWDEPFFSVSGGAGSTNDLDIYLTSPDGTSVYAQSITRNIGGDPMEVLQFTNNVDLFGQFSLIIANYGGPDPGLMKFVTFDTGFSPTMLNEYNTDSSTTFGHANAAGAEAVGAAFYGDTPAFGQDPPLLESFSSAGGTPILFDTAGNRLATPEIREKPGIVAPDGTNTSFFPQGNDTDGDGYPNFYGTSAAAPHAAAVAALMLQLNPSLSPADVYSTLESTAIDMDVAGFDFNTGYGLIQADLALANIPSDPRLSISIGPAEISENGGSTTASVTRWNTDLGAPLSVALASSDTTEAIVPATVTIPADASSVTFVINGVDDSLSDETQTVTITATAAGLLDGHDTLRVTDDEPQLISQWAATVVGFSTQWYDPFNPGAWQAIQALGAPDTFQYGDIETAWEASTADGNGVEYLTLGYATPVLATGATVRETYGNGFVTRIEVREAGTSTLHTVWSGTDPSLPGSPVDFAVSWPQTGFFVDALKVTVNSYHVMNDWEAIDAIQLVGWDRPPISDTTPPAAPVGLAVNVPVNLGGVLELDWADNTDSDLAGYNVYRSETSGSSYSQITADVINSAYTDTGLTDGTTYYYVVTAVDSSGNESGNSTEAWGTPDNAAPLPPMSLTAADRLADQGQAVELNWTVSTSGDAVGQRLYRGTTDSGPYALVQTFGNNSTNSYTDTVLTNGVTYYYVIRAYDGSQESGDSNQASAAPIDNLTPAAPTGLAATASDGQVVLNFNGNSESDLAGYNVYRGQTSGGPYSPVNPSLLNVTAYTDTNVTNGTTYYYVVTAVDTSGNESPGSGETSATPQSSNTPVQALATSDIHVAGSVANNYSDTRASDGLYESITERESGGKRQNRYSYLEHKWTFDATPGSAVTFYLEAHATASSDGDEFVFAYSTDDSTYVDMLTVTKTADDNSYQAYALPGSINGTVYVRVRDTDRGRGNRSRDTISVDHMYIETIPGEVDFAPTVSLAQPIDGNSVSGSQLIQIDATDPEDALGALVVEWNIDGAAWQTASYNALTAYYEAAWDTTAVAEGSHTINARAADSVGNVTADSVGVTVDNIATSTMHVGDIDGRAKLKGKKWQAFVTVLIHDDTESPLGNAIVTGTWSGSFGGAASGTTGSDGSVTFSTGSISNGDSVTFTVDTVSGNLAYSSGENHDGDLPADSSGTAILVNKDNTTAAPLLTNLDVALADLFLDESDGNRKVQGWDIANNLRAVDRLMATFGAL